MTISPVKGTLVTGGRVSHFQQLVSGSLYLSLKTVLHAFTINYYRSLIHRKVEPNLLSQCRPLGLGSD